MDLSYRFYCKRNFIEEIRHYPPTSLLYGFVWHVCRSYCKYQNYFN